MIHNTNFFEQIEEYCLEQLSENLKVEFESELAKNPALRQELQLRMEIRDSIIEKDVFTLRGKLKKVAKQNKPKSSGNESFDLVNEFSEIHEISEVLSSEDLINFFDSLPKVHAYHHEVASNENVHQFYKNQNKTTKSSLEEDFEDFDMEIELEGLEEAILEKDILEFRQTLKQVAKSLEPQFGVEDIDDFINGELSGNKLIDFERDLAQNRSLKEEVELHKELDLAMQEFDIMKIRNQISNIIQTETSWNVSESSIEAYIDGILDGELLDEFNAELADNTDLMAEVNLRRQINDFLSEKDVFNLRNELKAAKDDSEVKQVKMLIPDTKIGQFKFWRNSAAIIIVLLGIAGVIGNGLVSVDNIYSSSYDSPTWSPERAVVNDLTFLQQANLAYLNADFGEVLSIFGNAPDDVIDNPVYQFYMAASLQNLNKYDDAITSYTNVIEDGDNLYIEEAEWYRSLCYLKSGNEKLAKQQLLAIIKRKGDFENDAKVVLRRIRYSMKIN